MEDMFSFKVNDYPRNIETTPFHLRCFVDLIPLLSAKDVVQQTKEEVNQQNALCLPLKFRGQNEKILGYSNKWSHVEVTILPRNKKVDLLLEYLSQCHQLETLLVRQYSRTPSPRVSKVLTRRFYISLLHFPAGKLTHFKLHQVKFSFATLSLLVTAIANLKQLEVFAISCYLEAFREYLSIPEASYIVIALAFLKLPRKLLQVSLELLEFVSPKDIYCLLLLCDRVVIDKIYLLRTKLRYKVYRLVRSHVASNSFTKCLMYHNHQQIAYKGEIFE